MDGPAPESPASRDGDEGDGVRDEPSRLSIVFHRVAGRFLSFRGLLVAVTAVWLAQSFLWGGVYLGCGLTVAAALAALAGLILRDYVSRGSVISRCVTGRRGSL